LAISILLVAIEADLADVAFFTTKAHKAIRPLADCVNLGVSLTPVPILKPVIP